MNFRFPITCCDGFYEDPDVVREYALSLDYENKPGVYPGFRSDMLSELNEEFCFKAVNKMLSMFDDFDPEGNDNQFVCTTCFQKIWPYSENKDDTVNNGWIHFDGNTIVAAVVYLDPNPTVDSGTSMYFPLENYEDFSDEELTDIRNTRRKITSTAKPSDQELLNKYEKYLIKNNSRFEKTLEIKNRYNRMIAYDGQQYHAQSSYWSEHEEFRLTQVFFLDEMIVPQNCIPKTKCERYGI
jgi:hypothetical protein|tara:strand:+ start:327 stop:1046 length:720 start_codon:yes stop_codon:yes gene_type:complete